MTAPPPTPSAGWYPDPEGGNPRYWDGSEWLPDDDDIEIPMEQLADYLKALGLDSRSRDRIKLQTRDRNTTAAEHTGQPGVYVYTFPHYLRTYSDNDRTLLKVGHSSSSAIKRVWEQTNNTSLPEAPILLRIYPTAPEQSANIEKQFHQMLTEAGHSRRSTREGGAGTEWFATNIAYLDTIADTLGLTATIVNDADPGLTGPTEALNQIAALMSGKEWNPDTLDQIARILTAAGHQIEDQ